MPPYRAQRQSLFGNVGGPQEPGSGGVDYAAVLDSLTNAGSSLIQQAYVRKVNERNARMAQERLDFDRGVQMRDENRKDVESGRSEFDRAHKRKVEDAELLAKGYHEEEHSEPTGRSIRVPTGKFGAFKAPGAITRAMTGGAAQIKKEMEPAPMENVEQRQITQPAGPHFDLDKNIDYRKSMDRAGLEADVRGGIAAQNNATKLAVEAMRGHARIQAADMAAKNRMSILQFQNGMKSGTPQSLAQLNNMRVKMADGLLELYTVPGVSMEENLGHAMTAMTQDPELAKLYRESGVTTSHLAQAFAMRNRAANAQSITMQNTSGETPGEAGSRQAATGKTTKGGAPKQPTRQQIIDDAAAAIAAGKDRKKVEQRRDSLLATMPK